MPVFAASEVTFFQSGFSVKDTMRPSASVLTRP